MRKPFLGLETIAGLCVRCTGVSQGGSVHEMVAPGQGGKTHGVVLAHVSTWETMNGALPGQCLSEAVPKKKNTRWPQLLKTFCPPQMNKVFKNSVLLLPAILLQETGFTTQLEAPVSLHVKIQCWDSFLGGYWWQIRPLQIEEGTCCFWGGIIFSNHYAAL